MENIIQFITNGSTEFTPQILIGLVVFCLIIECIGSVAYNILKVGR